MVTISTRETSISFYSLFPIRYKPASPWRRPLHREPIIPCLFSAKNYPRWRTTHSDIPTLPLKIGTPAGIAKILYDDRSEPEVLETEYTPSTDGAVESEEYGKDNANISLLVRRIRLRGPILLGASTSKKRLCFQFCHKVLFVARCVQGGSQGTSANVGANDNRIAVS